MQRRIQYMALFVLLALPLWWLAASASVWLAWPASSCTVLAAAYGSSRPAWICGKNVDGSIRPFPLVVNLPWLILTWAVWALTAVIGRERAVDAIPGTPLSISRYPLASVDLAQFDLIFDLTSEFPRFYRPAKRYECLPNLDGVPLVRLAPASRIEPHEQILVHCAQGHGRSATFAARLLCELDYFTQPETAYRAILAARPGARLADCQLQQLRGLAQWQADTHAPPTHPA
jgi:hypothetical protein